MSDYNLGRRIEAERKRRGMTRAELARRLRCDYSTAWRWERGRVTITGHGRVAIKSVLGIE